MNADTKIKLLELEALLMSHDWFYARSEDPRFYHNGRNSQALIHDIMEQLKEHGLDQEAKDLYSKYQPNVNPY